MPGVGPFVQVEISRPRTVGKTSESRFIVNAIQNRTIANRPRESYGPFTTFRSLFLFHPSPLRGFRRTEKRATKGSIRQRWALFRSPASSGRGQRVGTVTRDGMRERARERERGGREEQKENRELWAWLKEQRRFHRSTFRDRLPLFSLVNVCWRRGKRKGNHPGSRASHLTPLLVSYCRFSRLSGENRASGRLYRR